MRSRLSGLPRQNPATPSRRKISVATVIVLAVCCSATVRGVQQVLLLAVQHMQHMSLQCATGEQCRNQTKRHRVTEEWRFELCRGFCREAYDITRCRSCSILMRSKGATTLRLTTAEAAPDTRCATYSRAPSSRSCQNARRLAARRCRELPLSSGGCGCQGTCRAMPSSAAVVARDTRDHKVWAVFFQTEARFRLEANVA